MSDQNSTFGGTLQAESETPSIRDFQIDPNGLGGIAESINLFRGDVNLPLKLITITSRSGLQADASLIYKSNLGNQVDLWNQDAPTGIVGLGWTLGIDYIVLDSENLVSPGVNAYYLVSEGSPNRLHLVRKETNYWEFELENYKFWQIRYFPALEEWVIIREEGNRYTYGGIQSDFSKSALQYKIKWQGSEGNWVGASVDTLRQSNYVTGWKLARVSNPFDDGIDFAYENDMVTIGNNGLQFTAATRLSRVTAAYSRSLHFTYGEKESFEYQPKHINPSAPDLHAFQDPIETHFLKKIELRNAEDAASAPGELLTSILFRYDFANVSIDNQNDNNFKKRYLTEVLYRSASGLDLPNFNFQYYNRSQDINESTNRGALHQIIYPQGGTITYDYQLSSLSGTERSTQWTPSNTTRFWFTESYVVMAEYDGINTLEVQIFSWNGQWVKAPQTFHLNDKVDLTTLKVSTQSDFFALSFISEAANKNLNTILFHRQPGRFGQWLIDEDVRTLSIASDGEGLITTGDNFVLALTSPGRFFLLRWDNRSKTWIDDSNSISISSNKQYAIAGNDNYLAIASYDEQTRRALLQLYYLDAEQQFQQADLQIQDLNDIDWNEGMAESFWSLGSNFAVMTYVNNITNGEVNYSINIQQWNELFQAELVVEESYQLPEDTELPFTLSVASGDVVGNLGHLFRYNGLDWITDEIPVVEVGDIKPKIVYGSDSAISVSRNFGQLDFFDPYSDSWNKVLNEPGFEFTPTATGNYFSIGRSIYIRENTGTLKFLGSFPQNIVPNSIINRAPLYFAYEDQSGNTFVWPMKNGVLTDLPIELPNQKIVNDSTDPGTDLVGLNSLVTYEGRFENPSRFNLYQFVNEDIEGEIQSFPVIRLSINDGYPVRWGEKGEQNEQYTRYYYDCEHVTVSSSGKVTEFAAATSVYGESDILSGICYPPPSETILGNTEFRYHNNGSAIDSGLFFLRDGAEDPNYLYSYLNGMLFDSTDYDAEGNPVQRNVNYYEVREKYAELGSPDSLKPLIGAYVKRISIENTQYNDPIILEEKRGMLLNLQALEPSIAAVHQFENQTANASINLLSARRRGLFKLYTQDLRQTWFPITFEDGKAQTATGVVRVIDSRFSYETGLLLGDATTSFNTEGAEQVFRREIYYAWQVPDYTILKNRHIWSPIAVSIRLGWTKGVDPDFQPTDLTLTTYRSWGDDSQEELTPWAPEASWIGTSAEAYNASANGIPVNFDQWLNAPAAVEHWRRTSLTQKRTSTGALITALDVAEVPSTNILGKNDTYRLAEFTNATREEASYVGFEDYETMDGWELSTGKYSDWLVSGDAHTGLNSLRLPAEDGPTLSKTFELQGGRTYILAYWIKTNEGFAGASGEALWKLSDAQGKQLATHAIEGTDQIWSYQHWAIQLSDSEGGTLQLKLENNKATSSGDFLVDDILMSPLESEVDAAIFHPRFGDKTAELIANGSTRLTTYDSYRRATAMIENEQVKTVTSLFSLRQWMESSQFVFQEAYPNMTLNIRSGLKAAFANLTQGEEWKTDWASATISKWKTQNNQLLYTANAQSTLRFNPSESYENYGARVSFVQPIDEEGQAILPTKSVGMALGTQLSVEWVPANENWILTLEGQEIVLSSPVPSHTAFGTDWLLMAPIDPATGTHSIYFMVDGLILYAKQNAPAISGSLRLSLAEKDFGFESISCFRGAVSNAQYLDGAGKELQQVGLEGDSLIVQETLYDLIGRAALTTKATRVENTSLQYIVDFIAQFDPVSGILQGEVATLNPEAEGFPYFRSAFKKTAQQLVRYQGLPGKAFSIIATPGSENPHVTKYDYGTNSADQIPPLKLPANAYFINQVTNPNDQQSFRFTTKVGQEIACLEGRLDDGSFNTTLLYYDNAQRLVKVLPPEGVQALRDGEADAGGWANIQTYNFQGELISSFHPDTGQNQYIYNRAGLARFVLTADGQAVGNSPSTILYSKYDSLGRTLEKGFFSAVWNYNQLIVLAISDPDFPGDTQEHQVINRFEYDGDGSNPLLLGRLTKAYTFDEKGDEKVKLSYTYDLEGNVLEIAEVVPEFDSVSRSLGFEYNNQSKIIRLIYPTGADLEDLYYHYNSLGQLLSIGSQNDPTAHARYTYFPSGAVDTALSVLGNSQVLETKNQLNSPGWPTNKTTQLDGQLSFEEELKYTEGGYNDASYYDGKVAAASFNNGETQDTYQYLYDQLSRIKVAANTKDTTLNLGVKSPVKYDLNGNIVSWSKGGVVEDNQYTEGSDQLDSVKVDNTTIDAFEYDKNGNATKADRLGLDQIHYEKDSNLTKSIELGANPKHGEANSKVHFSYNPGGQRMLKRQLDQSGEELSSRLYLRNISDQSLYEEVKKKGQANQAYQYIYGADGLSSVVVGKSQYYLIRDSKGSIRKVINQTGATVATFRYTPFGVTISGRDSTDADLIVYRFTGQEYDTETGLYAFPARMYDPETGRFFSVDPKQIGNTPYSYVLNNPVNLVDPDGEEPFSIAALLISIVVSAIIGLAAGLITYAATHTKGDFKWTDFLLYGVSGLISGAISGGLAYLVGPLAVGSAATAVAVKLGFATATVGRGIVIGAIQGAAGGAIGGATAGALNQVGVNLINGKDPGKDVGRQLGIGLGLGFVFGAVGGGFKGGFKARFQNNNAAAGAGAPLMGGGGGGGAVALTKLQKTGLLLIDVLARSSTATFLRTPLFVQAEESDQKGAGQNGVSGANVSGAVLAKELGERNGGAGLSLSTSYVGQRGTLESSANELKTPVRSANNRGPEEGLYTRKLRQGWRTIHAY